MHGNKVETVIDHAFLESGDYAQIVRTAEMLAGLIREDAQVRRGETVRSIQLVQGRPRLAPRGSQRLHGDPALQGPGRDEPRAALGDDHGPEKRILLKVQIEDAISAGEIFSTLMGDEVEPRRQFIETNALGVTNLDV